MPVEDPGLSPEQKAKRLIVDEDIVCFVTLDNWRSSHIGNTFSSFIFFNVSYFCGYARYWITGATSYYEREIQAIDATNRISSGLHLY